MSDKKEVHNTEPKTPSDVMEEAPNAESRLDDAIRNAASPEEAINIIKVEADRISDVIKKLCIPNSTAAFTDLPEENGLRTAMREKIAPQMIESTQTFQELYNVLEKIGEIPGSDNTPYFCEDLIGIIEKVRNGSYSTDYVTKSYGLRSAVIRLLGKKLEPNDPPPTPAGAEMSHPKSPTPPPEKKSEVNTTPNLPDNPTSPQPAYHTEDLSAYSEKKQKTNHPSNDPDEPMSPKDNQSASSPKTPLTAAKEFTQENPPNSPEPEKVAKVDPEFFRPNDLFPQVGLDPRLSPVETTNAGIIYATVIRYTHDKHIIARNIDGKTLKIPLKDLLDPKTGKPFASRTSSYSNNSFKNNQSMDKS